MELLYRQRDSNGCSSHHQGALTVPRWSVFRVQLTAVGRDKQPSGEMQLTAWARVAWFARLSSLLWRQHGGMRGEKDTEQSRSGLSKWHKAEARILWHSTQSCQLWKMDPKRIYSVTCVVLSQTTTIPVYVHVSAVLYRNWRNSFLLS